MTKTTKTGTTAKTATKKPSTKAEPTTAKATAKTVAKETKDSTVMNPPTTDSITKQLKQAEEKNKKAQLAEDRRLYKRFKCQIDKAYQNMENSYLQTAFALHAIYKNKLYRLDNFKNIYDFAKENYTIARGTCNNFINICEKFGVPNENGNIMELSPDYAQYSVSQLAVMLAFPRELLEKCDKTKSVRELKRMRIEYENGLRTTANAQAIETAMKESPADSTEPSTADGVADAPSGGTTKLDITESSDNVFVCQASTVEELFSFRSIINDTFHDILEGNQKKNARLEVRIVY